MIRSFLIAIFSVSKLENFQKKRLESDKILPGEEVVCNKEGNILMLIVTGDIDPIIGD